MTGIRVSHDGMILRYGTADTPAPNAARVSGDTISFKAAVEPPHPSNVVTVNYQIDEGVVRAFRATPATSGFGTGSQYFVARFPRLPRGSDVRYGVHASRTGRRVPARGAASRLPYTFHYEGRREPPMSQNYGAAAPQAGASESSEREPFALEFLCTVEAQLDRQPEIIGQTPEGIRANFYVHSGTVRGPRLHGVFEPDGGDWMTIRRDGVGVPSVRATLKTDDGALIYMWYTGVFELGEDGYANFLKQKLPERPSLRFAPHFVTGHDSYAWINRLQCVGIGHVHMKQYRVHYDLYALK